MTVAELYLRQHAWLSSAPEGGAETRWRVWSERAKLRGLEYIPDLPVRGQLWMIIDWLFEAGLVSRQGDMTAPISWTEIMSWSNIARVMVSPREAKIMRRLSFAYADQINACRNGSAKEPMEMIRG